MGWSVLYLWEVIKYILSIPIFIYLMRQEDPRRSFHFGPQDEYVRPKRFFSQPRGAYCSACYLQDGWLPFWVLRSEHSVECSVSTFAKVDSHLIYEFYK